MDARETTSFSVVGLGEALYDRFPDRTVLGGAPLNLAYHAHQLLAPRGGGGIVASRVGEDEDGSRVLAELQRAGINLMGIQTDPNFPTGDVVVTVDEEGNPSYQISQNVAWDHLEFTDSWAQLARECSAVCFGTLAQRSDQSRQTIRSFLQSARHALRLFDVNLRQDFFSASIIENSLRLATAVKLNEQELPIVCESLGISAGKTADEMATTLLHRFGFEPLVLTRGPRGTVLFTNNQRVEGRPVAFSRSENADGVGAGDASCAAVVCGLLLKWPLPAIADFANRMGAFVASRPGATPELDPSLASRSHQDFGR